jgi:hypothetical protein
MRIEREVCSTAGSNSCQFYVGRISSSVATLELRQAALRLVKPQPFDRAIAQRIKALRAMVDSRSAVVLVFTSARTQLEERAVMA